MKAKKVAPAERGPSRRVPLPPEVLEYFRRQGAIGGKLSGKARMEKLTPEQRSEIARKAVMAREAKRARERRRGK